MEQPSSTMSSTSSQPAPVVGPLLRDWTAAPHPPAALTTVGEDLEAPPVAPAVVLNERASSTDVSPDTEAGTATTTTTTPSENKPYSYPVATFVSNFVRTSVSELRDHIYAVSVEDDVEADGADPMSIRSAPPTSAAVPPLATTGRSLNTLLDSTTSDQQEYVLINGDLVALPTAPEEDEMTQYSQSERPGNHLSHNAAASQVACRPRSSRVRRGVRGFKKWMKRVRKKKPPPSLSGDESHSAADTLAPSSTGEQPSEAFSVSPPPSASASLAEHPEALPAPPPPAMSPPRGADMTPPKNKKPKKKKRFSFLRDIESRNYPLLFEAQSGPEETVVPPVASSSVVAGESSRQTWSGGMARRPPAAAAAALPAARSTRASAPSTMSLDEPPYPAAASFGGIHGSDSTNGPRNTSIVGEASFIGHADQLLAEGVVLDASTTLLPAEQYYIEDRLDDYDKYDESEKKRDAFGYPYRSQVPSYYGDIKVDKQDAPCVDTFLSRAEEFAQDLAEDQVEVPNAEPLKLRGKSDGSSVPLSEATSSDPVVHNDILKVVLVGAPTVDKAGLARSIRQSTKKSRKRKTLGVEVHTWSPAPTGTDEPYQDVKFSLWDVQGASASGSSGSPNSGNSSSSSSSNGEANFGAHPGTQSLFFSDRSLFLLVWDLAANNRKTHRRRVALSSQEDSSSSEEEDEKYHDQFEDNLYACEESNRQADRALRADIEDRVLSWVDCIARSGQNTALLPIGLVPPGMAPDEAKRRCDTMTNLLMEYTTQRMPSELVPPKVLMGAETMICVSLSTDMGMDLLRTTIVAIATDPNHSVFDHVGTPVPRTTIQVLETCRRFKQDHKLILVDHILADLPEVEVDDVFKALDFLASIGELFYYGGNSDDEVLSRYVILSRKWLVSALSCILRNDLKRELTETRRFMNMQCIYSDQHFLENHVTQTFGTSSSICPLLSGSDTQMLWQSMSFMREAADKSSFLQENSTSTSTMFTFLERLLVHSGVFLPVDIDRLQSPDSVYFVPALLSPADTHDMWTYKSSESWMTTLAHTWLFRDGSPVHLLERVTVALLRDLYEFSRTVSSTPQDRLTSPAAAGVPPRANTFPFGHGSMADFVHSHNTGEPVGSIKIHQICTWRSSILIKIGCVFPDGEELRESFCEIFVSLADPSSPHCVSSDTMSSSMQRLIVSGKGQIGHHGIKLWRGGYSLVLDSIKSSLANCTNVDRQVVCPECLAGSHPSVASTWAWDSVRAAAGSGNSMVRCMRGHRVDSNLICGTCRPPAAPTGLLHHHHGAAQQGGAKKSVPDLLPSVVVVGLWDADSQTIRNVGSGFVVDRKHGLVVTAGHILFNMEEGRQFGTPFFGLENAKAVVGIIPTRDDEGSSNDRAVFRYFAEIVADDIHCVDACVLRITTRLHQDVEDDSQIAGIAEDVIDDVMEENLMSLKMTRRYELEETVRILGFNQGGEGLLEKGKHVNRSADFAKGYICKQFKMSDDPSNSNYSDEDESSTCSINSAAAFSPREEIVVMCPTISGHSGGPCVNDEGKVVGILSRADPVDRQRCYLVPVNELKILVSKAKKVASRGGSNKSNMKQMVKSM